MVLALVIALGLERSNVCVIYVMILFSCHGDRSTDSDYRLCDFYVIKCVGIDKFIVYVIMLIENAYQRSMSRKCVSEDHARAHALTRVHASCVL